MLKSNKSSTSRKKKTKTFKINMRKNKKPRKSQDKDMQITKVLNANLQHNDTDFTASTDVKCAYNKSLLASAKKISFLKCLEQNSTIEKTSTIRSPNISTVHSDMTELTLKKSPNELFNSIYSGEIYLELPNRSWSMHCTNVPIKCIVVSKMAVINDNNTGFIPLYIKQIFFDEKMDYEILLLNSKTRETVPFIIETMTDMMIIIDYLDNINLCTGGPEVTLYNNINLECAYKDVKRKWRHNLCSLKVSGVETCELCSSLEELLKKQIQRNKQTSRSKSTCSLAKRRK